MDEIPEPKKFFVPIVSCAIFAAISQTKPAI